MERYTVIDRHEQYPGNSADTFDAIIKAVLGTTVHLGTLPEIYRAPETSAPIDEDTLAPQELPATHELVGDDPLNTREALQRALSAEAHDLAA